MEKDWWERRRIGWKCSKIGRWRSEACCPSNRWSSSGGRVAAVDDGDGPGPEPKKRTVEAATGRSGSMTAAAVVVVAAGAGAAASAEDDGGSESR